MLKAHETVYKTQISTQTDKNVEKKMLPATRTAF